MSGDRYEMILAHEDMKYQGMVVLIRCLVQPSGDVVIHKGRQSEIKYFIG